MYIMYMYMYVYYLIYAATPGVLQIQSDCNVIHMWRWRVCMLIPQPHHQEVLTGNFGELHQLQTLQAVFRPTRCSGFVVYMMTRHVTMTKP